MGWVMHYVPEKQFRKKNPLPVLCGEKRSGVCSYKVESITCKRCNKLLDNRVLMLARERGRR